MTAQEFRSNPELVKAMRALLETETMVLALEVMRAGHPVKDVPSPDITSEWSSVQLGKTFGYEKYDFDFKLLGKGIEIPQTTPPADYPDEPPPPEE